MLDAACSAEEKVFNHCFCQFWSRGNPPSSLKTCTKARDWLGLIMSLACTNSSRPTSCKMIASNGLTRRFKVWSNSQVISTSLQYFYPTFLPRQLTKNNCKKYKFQDNILILQEAILLLFSKIMLPPLGKQDHYQLNALSFFFVGQSYMLP